jgi:MFS family permease
MDDKTRLGILRVLYITIFFTSTGLGTCTFLLPVYAETFGATYSDLGLMGAIGNVVYTVITLVCGYTLDKYEKIKLYAGFTVFGAIIMILFLIANNLTELILVRGLLGLASASFWVSASTLTAEISPISEVTKSLGRYNLSWILGFTIGPYMGGLISNKYGYDVFFLASSGIIILSVLLISSKIYGKIKLSREISQEKAKLTELKILSLSYITLLPFTMVLGIYMAIIPGHMKVIGLSASLIGLILTITNGVRGIAFLNVERFVNWSTWRSIFMASIFLAISMYLVSSGKDAVSFVVPLVFYGIGSGIMTPVVLNFISKRTPQKLRGTAMGVHEGVYGVGMFFGPLIGGVIADKYSPMSLYSILVVVSLIIIPFGFLMTQDLEILNT